LASQRVLELPRPALWRAVALAAILFAALLPSVAAAAVPRAYAGIVVDAKSGKVLYSSNADAPRYPASVSKVMTLYVLFQELSAGRIKLTDKMPVSRWAASASPTKLGLKPGATITVENAIRAVVTLSANDMARVIAEYIGGSESSFGTRMTSTARSLGMMHTVYVNASGLPDRRQITTVRDQAILARAIYEHFPKFYAYFQTRSFSYGRRTYGNHNNLLGVNGIDGIKTGYTGAAGYNLMTAARIDGKHIVVVGFGFPSAGKRDAKVRGLVETYLPQAKTGDYLDVAMIPLPGRKGSAAASDTVQVATGAPIMPLPAPAFRDAGTDDEAPADPQIGVGDVDTVDSVASLAPMPLPRPIDIGMPAVTAATALAIPSLEPAAPSPVVGAYSASYTLGAPPAPLGQTKASTPLVPPVGVGDKGQPIDLMTSGSIEAEVALAEAASKPLPSLSQPMPQALPDGWIVQIGAAPTQDGANGLIDAAGQKIRALAQFQGFVQRFDKDGQTYFRARFGGFPGQDAANDICNQLKQIKMSCLAMQG
jgi:D-alanyl-D-alanine carboxypeptidase